MNLVNQIISLQSSSNEDSDSESIDSLSDDAVLEEYDSDRDSEFINDGGGGSDDNSDIESIENY